MKKTILILLGMILLVGIISAGLSLDEKESEYVTTYSYTVLDETNLVYELLDDEGNTFKVNIYDDSCKTSPIYKHTSYTAPCMNHPELDCLLDRTEIIGTEDTCYKKVILKVQDYYLQRDKLRAVPTIEEYQDTNLKDKIIDSGGNVK